VTLLANATSGASSGDTWYDFRHSVPGRKYATQGDGRGSDQLLEQASNQRKAPYLHRNGERQQRNLKGAGSEIGTTSVVGAMHNSDRHGGGLVSAEKSQIAHYTNVAMAPALPGAVHEKGPRRGPSFLNRAFCRHHRKLLLLFGTGIAVDSIWPHGHRACVHLLNISLLESPGNLTTCEFVPPVCLSEPLPAIFGVSLRALSAQQLHSAAVCDIAHKATSLDFDFYATYTLPGDGTIK
jgi:hypothetical protein